MRRLIAAVPQVVGDLDRQFPGRHHDEGLRRARWPGLDQLEQRDAEGERLAGTGPRLPDDVLPAQRQREGKRLNGKGGEDARRLQAAADLIDDAEITERDRVGIPAAGDIARGVGSGSGARQSGHGPGLRSLRLGRVPAKSLSCQGFHPSLRPSPSLAGPARSCLYAARSDPPRCELLPCGRRTASTTPTRRTSQGARHRCRDAAVCSGNPPGTPGAVSIRNGARHKQQLTM